MILSWCCQAGKVTCTTEEEEMEEQGLSSLLKVTQQVSSKPEQAGSRVRYPTRSSLIS